MIEIKFFRNLVRFRMATGHRCKQATEKGRLIFAVRRRPQNSTEARIPKSSDYRLMPINAADTISRRIGRHICNPLRGIAATGALTIAVSRVVIFGCLVGLVVTWAMSKVWPIAERPK